MSLNAWTPRSRIADDTPSTEVDLESQKAHSQAALARELLGTPARIDPKYLYDELGSKLFEAICLLPEYYPTRTEAAILTDQLDDIVAAVGTGHTLVDLGAGNCAKAAALFPVLQPSHYVPVDISIDFLQQAILPLQQRYPNVPVTPLGQDFSQGVRLPPPLSINSVLFFYPGSSIGNFGPDEAVRFLRTLIAATDQPPTLLLGIDLQKPVDVLEAAYNDPLGITASFNLNVLRNVNRRLQSDFDVHDWRHIALFNPAESRMEMHLEARHALTVRWPGQDRRFQQHERIHTENSYKYTLESLAELLRRAGFILCNIWTDDNDWFAVVHARPANT